MKITITTNAPEQSRDPDQAHAQQAHQQTASAPPDQAQVNLDPIDLFKSGWRVYKTTWKTVLSLGVVLLLVSMAGQIAVDAAGDSALAIVLDLASAAVQLFVSAGLIYSLLRVMRGKQAEIKDLFSQVQIFVTFLLTNIAYGLLFILGLLLFIIPGIYWALKYSMVPYLVVDKRLGVKAAFAESALLTSGRLWKLLVFTIAVLLLNLLGALALGIGLLFTLPVTALAQVELYRRLNQES